MYVLVRNTSVILTEPNIPRRHYIPYFIIINFRVYVHFLVPETVSTFPSLRPRPLAFFLSGCINKRHSLCRLDPAFFYNFP